MVGRHWLFRVSVGANAFVLFYFALYSSTTTFLPTTMPMDQPPSRRSKNEITLKSSEKLNSKGESSGLPKDFSLKVSEIQQPPLQEQSNEPFLVLPVSPAQTHEEENQNQVKEAAADSVLDIQGKVSQSQLFETQQDDGSTVLKIGISESPASREIAHLDFETEDVNCGENGGNMKKPDHHSNIFEGLKSFPCDDYTPATHFAQRGPFWVLYNYIKPRKKFKCDESITYTTHGDFTFLDNLIPLVERWEGPVSLSLYAPGTDFLDSLKRINYLRQCVNGSSLVKDYVTFHLFFDYKHIPRAQIPPDPSAIYVDCNEFTPEDIKFGEGLSTYKKKNKLPYPVNVARNVAREMSTTHYILPSDIELFPNPNLIPDFLEMIRRNDTPELQRPNPNKIYVLPIFEVEATVTGLPQDKSELVYMLRNKSAILFHKYVCANCHRIPKSNEWIDASVTSGLNVFHVGKRHKPYHHWEPIFIGTKRDPFYDERLTWEGRSDKMTQGYILCVLNYEFHILDNAFLVHRPGIKRTVITPGKSPIVARQNAIISKLILPELKQLFGTKSGCYV